MGEHWYFAMLGKTRQDNSFSFEDILDTHEVDMSVQQSASAAMIPLEEIDNYLSKAPNYSTFHETEKVTRFPSQFKPSLWGNFSESNYLFHHPVARSDPSIVSLRQKINEARDEITAKNCVFIN